MTVDLELAPKTEARRRASRCCEPVVYPDVEREQALRMAEVAKALGDPIRLQLVDVLRKHAGKVCVCELVPLFDVSQPTLSPPPQEAARRRDRRLRAARPVGLLLRHPRRAEGAVRMAELTTDLRDAARRQHRAAASRREGRLLRPRTSSELRLRPPTPRGTCASGARALRRRGASPAQPGCCGTATRSLTTSRRAGLRRRALRRDGHRGRLPTAPCSASLGCGVPTAVADLQRGRDRARPRLRRRRGRADLRSPRRPDAERRSAST